MKRLALILILAGSFACSTSRQKSTPASLSSTEVSNASSATSHLVNPVQIEKTMNRITREIKELEKLEELVYYKSPLKADPVAQKKLDEKIARYGSVDTLQANLRALSELKAQNEQAGSPASAN